MTPAGGDVASAAALAAKDRRRVLRETLLLALTATLIVAVGVVGLWLSATRTVSDSYRHYLVNVARTAALRVDPELHRALRQGGDMNGPRYTQAVAPLREVLATLSDVKSIYTMVRAGDETRFVLDAAPAGDLDGDGVEDQAQLGEVYTETEPAMEAALGDGRTPGHPAVTAHPYPDKWGSFMTGWAPLIDADGRQYGALGVDVDADVYFAVLSDARQSTLLGVVPATLLILLLTIGFHRLRTRYLGARREAHFAGRALASEQERLGQIVEQIDIGTWETEVAADGSYTTWVDARWAGMLGRDAADLNPLNADTFTMLVHPDDIPLLAASVEALNVAGTLLEFDVRLRHAEGHWVWTHVRGRVTECDAAGRPRRMVGTQVDASKRKAMESELAAAANRDRLTGLANRALFLQWLQLAIDRVRDGRQRGFATLFLDFDRFKLVNDAMGHEAGDGLLREIAARLRAALGASDDPLDGSGRNLVARFGGDEFLVLLNEADGALAQRISDDLIASLSRPFLLNEREVFSTASIGIVTSDQCLESAEAVVRNADVAMYEAKRSGRACAVRFDDAMRARLTRYVAIDSQLRAALETDQFSLVYQPIVDLHTGQVTSVEALARWHHPTLGAISPAEFIPIAEESGLIITLGQRALEEACAALAAWRAQDVDRAPQTVCVNVSRAELALGRRLLERVSATLFRFGLPPQCLRLEVTERDAMRDPVATLQLMRDLRDMGVRLAMDDFGTGTSSLGCLRDYPFDVIKIDRSFVSDVTTSPEVLALIHAAVTLVQNLGKTSVAEGIETAEQRAILQSLGCQFGQGYYFSRPLTDQEITIFMALPAAANG